MKKMGLIITIIGAALVARSQTLSPEVIANTGAYIVNNPANVSLSYTVGEMTMVQTFSNQENILTQGFQQPDDKMATGIINSTPNGSGSFTVYPNPAVSNVWIDFKLPEEANVNVEMYNELGQNMGNVYSSNYQRGSTVQQINISAFAAGIYFITLTFVSGRDNQVHIITQKLQVMK